MAGSKRQNTLMQPRVNGKRVTHTHTHATGAIKLKKKKKKTPWPTVGSGLQSKGRKAQKPST